MECDGGGSSSNEQYISVNSKNEEKRNTRHTPQQIEKLDAYFKECPHPDEAQRHRLGRELNMEVDQVKFWFQNKRTQSKAQDEKSSNILLRGENEKLKSENEAMREALENVVCPPCGGPPYGIDERERSLQKMRLENAQLKKRRDELANFVSKNKINRSTMVDSVASARRQQMVNTRFSYEANPSSIFALPSSLGPLNSQTVQPQELSQLDIAQLSEIAAIAVEELKRLFTDEKDFWVKSSIDGAYMINQESYEKFFHATRHFMNSGARVESSKDAAVVPIEATNLIEMFLDSEKWKDLFPTIVNKAKTIHMLGSDLPIKENCNVVQVIWEKQHILSSLVSAREFMIVRCCQEIEKGLWIIADVSHSIVNFDLVNAPCYKRPSGCLIQALPDGQSEVIWIEHVEVDDKSNAHQMYKDLLFGRSGYCAKRWIATLERMCERMVLSSTRTIPPTDWSEDHTISEEGRRNVMKVGERMLKIFNQMLTMSGKVDFPQTSNCGIRVSVRLNNEDGQPPGLVLSAASSFSVPFTPLQVFNILSNTNTRHQWDVLCHENPVSEVARFFTGSSETNLVNILKPIQEENLDMFMMTQNSDKNDMLMLQDCYMDALGGMLVYAPLDKATLDIAVAGQVNPCDIPILPSGFTISSDGRRSTEAEDGGTLITAVFQILMSGPPKVNELTEKSVDAVSTLVSRTIQNVKELLLNSPHV